MLFIMFIAENLSRFKNLFVSKLKNMLSEDELGAFILVLANSRQDEFLKAALNADLEKVFLQLKEKAANNQLVAPADDMDVFDQLMSLDLSDIPLWQSRMVGGWEIAYNSMRELRPVRSSAQRFDSTRQPFDENRFHFNKPFLKPEILWQGEFANHQLSVFYNKFPFSDYHLLVAVSPQSKQPQIMSQALHFINCALVDDSVFPGLGLGFNSMAAGASVNHLHCQGFIRLSALPIENKSWQHNGGQKKYPLPVRQFSDKRVSWEYIDLLMQQDIAFNCVYRKYSCYVIPRCYQGSIELPAWIEGAGWLDVAGVMTVSNKETFASLDAPAVENALSLMRL